MKDYYLTSVPTVPPSWNEFAWKSLEKTFDSLFNMFATTHSYSRLLRFHITLMKVSLEIYCWTVLPQNRFKQMQKSRSMVMSGSVVDAKCWTNVKQSQNRSICWEWWKGQCVWLSKCSQWKIKSNIAFNQEMTLNLMKLYVLRVKHHHAELNSSANARRIFKCKK